MRAKSWIIFIPVIVVSLVAGAWLDNNPLPPDTLKLAPKPKKG